MQAAVDAGEVAGVVTLVAPNGKPPVIHAAGFADREKKDPMKPDTIFEVMSMTKPVVATAIVMLAEEGRLTLLDPVERHLPEFKGQVIVEGDIVKKPSRPITIRDLLTHTSGMRENPPAWLGDLYQRFHKPLAEAVTIYSQQPLLFEPGTKWQYSNTGIATLGRIIEVVSDQPFERFLADRIFTPLNMKDTFLFVDPAKADRIATAYQADAQGKLTSTGDYKLRKGQRYSMPEGGMYSTAADMANFYQMMLDGGRFNGKRILSKSAIAAMTGNQTPGVANWGLGWSLYDRPDSTLALNSATAYGHGGAFGTFGWVDPKRKLVGVFMIQRFGGPPIDPLRRIFVEMANAAVTE
jgi:CubicO group peptidase (beta-lactamase class C family)